MATVAIDIEKVKRVLRRAVDGGASQRGLSKKAGLSRDTVYDILNDRNQNPTITTLASLAEALDTDISAFGLPRMFMVSEEQLREELAKALPFSSRLDDYGEQARYLAVTVAGALGLPRVSHEGADRPGGSEEPSGTVSPAAPTPPGES